LAGRSAAPTATGSPGAAHDAAINRDPYYDFYYAAARTLPQIEGNANYERLFESAQGVPRPVTTDETREKANQAMQWGCAGYTYGANGVWQATWDEERTPNQTVYGTTPWFVGIDLPGAERLKHWKAFYSGLPWSKLVPRPDTDGFAAWDVPLRPALRPAVSAEPGRSHVVVYFYRGAPTPGALKRLRDGVYRARWFNPLSGVYSRQGRVLPSRGQWRRPPKPDEGSGSLTLRAETLPGGSVPAVPSLRRAARARIEADRSRNVARGAAVMASSTDTAHPNYAAANAIDGRAGTHDWAHWSNDAAKETPSPEHPA
jgi:hypothetical protein